MTSLDQLTTEQLEAAWRILCAPDWPDLHTLATGAARLKLVQGYALRHARGLPVAAAADDSPYLTGTGATPPPPRFTFTPTRHAAGYDRKRAAAGDFDDKE